MTDLTRRDFLSTLAVAAAMPSFAAMKTPSGESSAPIYLLWYRRPATQWTEALPHRKWTTGRDDPRGHNPGTAAIE